MNCFKNYPYFRIVTVFVVSALIVPVYLYSWSETFTVATFNIQRDTSTIPVVSTTKSASKKPGIDKLGDIRFDNPEHTFTDGQDVYRTTFSVIRDMNPDVVCLQEISQDLHRNIFAPKLHRLGYKVGVYGQKGVKGGVVIYYKRYKFDSIGTKTLLMPVEEYKQDEMLSRFEGHSPTPTAQLAQQDVAVSAQPADTNTLGKTIKVSTTKEAAPGSQSLSAFEGLDQDSGSFTSSAGLTDTPMLGVSPIPSATLSGDSPLISVSTPIMPEELQPKALSKKAKSKAQLSSVSSDLDLSVFSPDKSESATSSLSASPDMSSVKQPKELSYGVCVQLSLICKKSKLPVNILNVHLVRLQSKELENKGWPVTSAQLSTVVNQSIVSFVDTPWVLVGDFNMYYDTLRDNILSYLQFSYVNSNQQRVTTSYKLIPKIDDKCLDQAIYNDLTCLSVCRKDKHCLWDVQKKQYDCNAPACKNKTIASGLQNPSDHEPILIEFEVTRQNKIDARNQYVEIDRYLEYTIFKNSKTKVGKSSLNNM